jgi:hypothetical protein
MLVDSETQTINIVFDISRKPGRPKQYADEQLKDHVREYNRRYYETNKEKVRHEALCPLCNKLFKDRPSINRHIKFHCPVAKFQEALLRGDEDVMREVNS